MGNLKFSRIHDTILGNTGRAALMSSALHFEHRSRGREATAALHCHRLYTTTCIKAVAHTAMRPQLDQFWNESSTPDGRRLLSQAHSGPHNGTARLERTHISRSPGRPPRDAPPSRAAPLRCLPSAAVSPAQGTDGQPKDWHRRPSDAPSRTAVPAGRQEGEPRGAARR